MAESDGENVVNKVNNLAASHLSLPGIQVEAAERKPKPDGKDAGVIVVKCLSYNDKKRIMGAKSKLNTTEHFKHIRIYQVKPLWQRQHEANIRVLVKSLGTHKLFVKGSHVCERGNHQDNWVNNNTGQGQRQMDGHASAVPGGRLCVVDLVTKDMVPDGEEAQDAAIIDGHVAFGMCMVGPMI